MQQYFEIWTRPNCTFCDQAKALLRRRGLSYEEVPLTAENADKFKERTNNARTVPQIFYHGGLSKHIGGFDELKPFVESWWPDNKE